MYSKVCLALTLLFCAFLQAGAEISWTTPEVDDPDGTDAIQIPENKEIGEEIKTYVAETTVEDGTVTYSLVDSPDYFSIGSETGVLTITADALDYETNVNFTLTVKASDDEETPNEGVLTVNVTIIDVNEKPLMDEALITAVVSKNTKAGDVVAEVMATDPDDGDEISYSIVDGNVRNTFKMTGEKVEVATGKTVDETGYVLTVRASDQELFDDATVIIVTHSCFESGTSSLNGGYIGTLLVTMTTILRNTFMQ